MSGHCPTCTCSAPVNEFRELAFRELAEWDWVQVHSDKGRRLHHLAHANWEEADTEWAAVGITTCGRVANPGVIPGMGSRMGAPRCNACCDALGYAHGAGSPKNDDGCKQLAKARVAALAAPTPGEPT